MKRFLRPALAALLLAAVLLLTGCMPFDLGTDGASGQDAAQAGATPLPELTAPLFTDYDAVYTHYSEVTFADTLPSLTERYGEPAVEEDESGHSTYTWLFEDGYGFTCAFFDAGGLRAKVVHYDDVRQFRDLCNASNLSSVVNFDKTITFQTCVQLFRGRPIEIAQIAQEEGSSSVARVYTWLDQADQAVQIFFKADGSVESISYQLND